MAKPWRGFEEVRRLVEHGAFERAEAKLRGAPASARATQAKWRGMIAHRQKRLQDALDALQVAIEAEPQDCEARVHSARVLLDMGLDAVAAREARAALRIAPEPLSGASSVLAQVDERAGRHGDALARWRDAYAANARDRGVWASYALSAARSCAWDEVDALRPRLLEDLVESERAGFRPACSPTSAMFLGFEPDDARRVASLWARSESLRATRTEALRAKLRLGFISPHLDAHPNGLLVQSVLRELKDGADVFAISWDSGQDEVRARIDARAQAHLDLGGRSDASALDAIQALDLDVLIDLGGFTNGQRMALLAARPARRVVHWLGSPGSMSRLVDARVSTPEWNPAEQDAYFEEPVLRYEGPLVAVDELPDVPAELSAPPEGAPCFVNLSDGYRITRRTFACWMDVLRRRSGASLWLAEGTDLRRERLRAAADEAGVDPSRITFRSDGPLSKGYAFAAADAWLDGLDIGAGTSGILCAWAGLPVLTSRGPTPWSMTGAAVVSAYAPDAEIARDADSLVRLAERYAPSMRDAWRARRAKSALFDVPKFARAFLQRLHML